MKKKKLILAIFQRKTFNTIFLLILFLPSFVFSANTVLKYRITDWLDNKPAAVSLTFDDWLPTHINTVIPLLKERKLTATFFLPLQTM